MKVGIIGHGMVGTTLSKYLNEYNKDLQIAILDQAKGFNDDLSNSDCIFICINVSGTEHGQDITNLRNCVDLAKSKSKNVLIKSTVNMGTNDYFQTTSCPEFLTARFAYQDMVKYPILIGHTIDKDLIKKIFTDKEVLQFKNNECELAKLSHNVFGALKVTFFNFVKKYCDLYQLDYNKTLDIMLHTGHINSQHTQVPGHDGFKGYGGTCFPNNMQSIIGMLSQEPRFYDEYMLFNLVKTLNEEYRGD